MTESRTIKLSLVLAVIGLLVFAWLVVSSLASTREALPANIARPAADGAALYRSKCAICHANDGSGKPNWRAKGQPDFTKAEWQKSRTDSQLGESVRNGKGKFMPAFKDKLSDEEINALISQVRAFGKKK